MSTRKKLSRLGQECSNAPAASFRSPSGSRCSQVAPSHTVTAPERLPYACGALGRANGRRRASPQERAIKNDRNAAKQEKSWPVTRPGGRRHGGRPRKEPTRLRETTLYSALARQPAPSLPLSSLLPFGAFKLFVEEGALGVLCDRERQVLEKRKEQSHFFRKYRICSFPCSLRVMDCSFRRTVFGTCLSCTSHCYRLVRLAPTSRWRRYDAGLHNAQLHGGRSRHPNRASLFPSPVLRTGKL